jgi:hypothetical protein
MRSPGFPSRRAIRTIALAGAALPALAATIAATASLATPGRVSATPRCSTSGLVIWLGTTGNGTAGSIYYNLYLTNLSRHTCTVRGYPGVSAVNLAGGRLGRAATRETIKKPSGVALAPGAAATAVLRIVDAGNFPASACRDVTAAGLRVYPPGQAASKLVPFPFKTCSRNAAADLSVRALT